MNLSTAINIMIWRAHGWHNSHLFPAVIDFAQEFAAAEGAVRCRTLIMWESDDGAYLAPPTGELFQGPAGFLIEWEDDRVEVISPFDVHVRWDKVAPVDLLDY